MVWTKKKIFNLIRFDMSHFLLKKVRLNEIIFKNFKRVKEKITIN